MPRRTTNDKTLAYFREKGLLIANVEKYNAFSGRKTDLFYIIDFLAITKDETIGIQSCGSDFAPHIVKLFIEERINTINWLLNKNRKLYLIGWRKVKQKRGGKREVYKPRLCQIKYENKKLFFKYIDS